MPFSERPARDDQEFERLQTEAAALLNYPAANAPPGSDAFASYMEKLKRHAAALAAYGQKFQR